MLEKEVILIDGSGYAIEEEYADHFVILVNRFKRNDVQREIRKKVLKKDTRRRTPDDFWRCDYVYTGSVNSASSLDNA